MDQLRALEVFVAIAEAGSFAGAARALSISPPSVTRIIGDLEEELGAVLLHRTTRLVTLTDVGQAYLADAQRILADLVAANDTARGAYSAPTGLLRITAPSLFGQYYVSPIILDYLDRYPEVSVDAVFVDRVVNLIEEGLDLAVRIGHLEDSSMMAAKVGEVRWMVCGCPSYFEEHGTPREPKDLAQHRTISIVPTPSALQWRFADGATVRIRPRLAFSTIPAAIAAATSGWGLVRVLSYQIGPMLGSGGLQTVLTEFELPPLPIHVVHGDGRRTSAKVRAFVDLAVDRLRADPFLNSGQVPR
ncbi:MAG: LysR family transcriptional regulator [Pseudomonadota bacterium]